MVFRISSKNDSTSEIRPYSWSALRNSYWKVSQIESKEGETSKAGRLEIFALFPKTSKVNSVVQPCSKGISLKRASFVCFYLQKLWSFLEISKPTLSKPWAPVWRLLQPSGARLRGPSPRLDCPCWEPPGGTTIITIPQKCSIQEIPSDYCRIPREAARAAELDPRTSRSSDNSMHGFRVSGKMKHFFSMLRNRAQFFFIGKFYMSFGRISPKSLKLLQVSLVS